MRESFRCATATPLRAPGVSSFDRVQHVRDAENSFASGKSEWYGSGAFVSVDGGRVISRMDKSEESSRPIVIYA